MESAVLDAQSLVGTLASVRKGKTVVAVSGSFDILHEGHTAILSEARSLGDILIVFLNSDTSIRDYKGPGRPVEPEQKRLSDLMQLGIVDYITVFDALNPLALIDALKPDVYVNGSEWGERCIEAPHVAAYGGRLHIVRRDTVVASSTAEREKRGIPDESSRAAFIDRDGVILNDVGYLHASSDAEFLPDAIEGLRELGKKGYQLIVVTNQSGIGRGLFPASDVEVINTWMRDRLAAEDISLTDIYVCPHAPEDGCDCRKPKPGLLIRASREHGISLEKSVFIGDKASDVACGRLANMAAIRIESSYDDTSPYEPSATATDLRDAAQKLS